MTVRVETSDFDISAEMARLTAGNTGIGAVASFVGKVRDHVEGAPLTSMTLEHYAGMTEAELERIEAEANRRFKSLSLAHRSSRRRLEARRQHRSRHRLRIAPASCFCCCRVLDGLFEDACALLEEGSLRQRQGALGRGARKRRRGRRGLEIVRKISPICRVSEGVEIP